MIVLCYVTLHDLRDFADVIQVTNQLALSKSKGRLSGSHETFTFKYSDRRLRKSEIESA